MSKNSKDINHTRYIYRGVHFVRNGEKSKLHKIDWCEVGPQWEEITTKNFGENDLNHRMKYITVRIDN